jgi:Leucine-rich repeat (LRR) protein
LYFSADLKSKLIIPLLLIISTCFAQVETYVVQDLNFRNFLNETFPEVLENDSTLIVAACDTILQLDCNSADISNLDGIQFFSNLTHLNCSYNPITELLELPENLTHLNCSYSVVLDSLGELPNSLEYLNCSYNQLRKLPTLPIGLEQLYCSVNHIEEIEYFPFNLTHLDCSFNNISNLPYLPDNLAHINCSYNLLTSLPDLPPNLGVIYNNPLNIFNNEIECVRDYTPIFEDLLGIYPQCTDSENEITQDIALPEGWSIFSLRGINEDMNIEHILLPIVDDIIMAKDNLGSVFLTEWGYNGVGNIILGQAYQVKTSQSTSLSVNLEYVIPESHPVNMYQGWNMIGYLRNEPAPADLVLNQLIETGNLTLAKDHSGAVVIPEWNYNGIGDMEPGKGYQVKLNEAAQLHFLPNGVEYRNDKSLEKVNNTPKHLPTVAPTDNNQIVGIHDYSWPELPNMGDEIAAFDMLGNIVGTCKYTSPITVITLWGDDNSTPEKDGLFEGESFHFKLWNSSSNSNTDVSVASWITGANTYSTNAMYEVEVLSFEESNIDQTFKLISTYPNPVKSELNIRYFTSEKGEVQIELVDPLGNITLKNTTKSLGFDIEQYKLDVSNLKSGCYFLRLTSDYTSITKPILIQ